jgi:HD superfamily phosphohydrolase
METARKILDQLAQSMAIDAEGRTICVVAALLHDLGHGPFSHVFERVSGVHHEELTRGSSSTTERGESRPARSRSRDAAKDRRLLECRPKRTFFCDIITSQLDADRFDYLLRDNLMTGARYGFYDLQWVLHALTIEPSCDRLASTSRGSARSRRTCRRGSTCTGTSTSTRSCAAPRGW